MDFENFAEVAKNVAAVAGAIVGVVAVYRIPAVNRALRWFGRRLLSEPLGGWAQKQVGAVVDDRLTGLKEQSQEATAWLSEGQERLGGEVIKLRQEWQDGHTAHGERLNIIDTRTRQLQPNGGQSIYDRLARMEAAAEVVAANLACSVFRADAADGPPGEAADEASRSASRGDPGDDSPRASEAGP